MKEKKIIIYFAVPIIFMLAISFYYLNYNGILDGSTNTNINFIIDHLNNVGDIVDYKNEIDCKSIEDIKLFVKDDTYKIEFGKIQLEWGSEEELMNVDLLNKLERIGIKIYRDEKTGELRFFYKGEELERWVS